MTGTSYSSTGLAASTTYYFKVEAVDADGASVASAQASAKTLAAGACTATAIVPYIYTASTGWVKESSISVASGTAVDLGPQPISGGSWSWAGPNGFTSTSRQINSIALSAGANVYTATYTNASGCKSTQAFTVTVK